MIKNYSFQNTLFEITKNVSIIIIFLILAFSTNFDQNVKIARFARNNVK